jgi:hypothetical protein
MNHIIAKGIICQSKTIENMKYLVLSIFLIISVFNVQAQKDEISQTKAINNYILFANESDHGMLIIHRLLELYNQEINKYVNLPQYKLNLFFKRRFSGEYL